MVYYNIDIYNSNGVITNNYGIVNSQMYTW